MKIKLAASFLALFCLHVEPAMAAHGRGLIVITVPTDASPSAGPPTVPSGTPVDLPLEITQAPPTGMLGHLTPGQVIAQHTVQVEDAIVLLDDVQGKKRLIPAGTPLAKAIINGKTPIIIWCDVRQMGAWSFGNFDCLASPDGEGQPTELWTGKTEAIPSVGARILDVGQVGPVRYRKATTEERPTSQIGYRYCGRQGNSAPRFATAVEAENHQWNSGVSMQCELGVWDDPGHVTATVDRIKLAVTEHDGDLTYTVLGRIPAQEIAAPVLGDPIGSIDQAQQSEAKNASNIPSVSEPALKASGQPIVATGVIHKGDSILSLPVEHAITGRLRNEVKGLGLFVVSPPLLVDQSMYGIPMYGSAGANVTWCAPRLTDVTRHVYTTMCLPRDATGYRWVKGFPPLFVTSLMWQGSTSAASTPDVERGPVNLPPMRLSYLLAGWEKQWVSIDVKLITEDGDLRLTRLRAPIRADGDATLQTMAGLLRLRSSGQSDEAEVEQVTP